MKIVICWTITNAYMASCWKELSRRAGVEVFIIGHQPEAGDNSPYTSEILEGLSYRLLAPSERGDYDLVLSQVLQEKPDVVYIPGWLVPTYMRLAKELSLSHVPFIMGIDTSRKDTLRQRFARLKIGWLLDRISAVLVIGERSWQFAKHIKVPEHEIRRGTCGVDYQSLSLLMDQRLSNPSGWPKAFLYVGRYADVKGLPVLVEAYKIYRRKITEPWPLRCCGMGPDKVYLDGVEGIEDLGFLQPPAINPVRVASGVFVIPSLYDPWPLAIVENCAAGLPVVCSEACGSSVECVRSYYNGLTVPTGDPHALADALSWMHTQYDTLPEMGRRSQQLAEPFGARYWADRFLATIEDCCGVSVGAQIL